MIVVLKNNLKIEEKLNNLFREMKEKDDYMLTITTNSLMHDDVVRHLKSINLLQIPYGKEIIYVTKDLIKIEIKKVDKYI
jgi:hypothetical protein